jgi:ParB-like chromosome segregation protein Spo0J
MKELKLKNELVDPKSLKPSEINPNRMTDREFEDLKKRMVDYGEPNVPDPIFISNDGFIIGGHHRVKAALQLGWNTIRATRVMNELSRTDRMFLQLQHNKHGNPDDKLLREYYSELQLIADLNSIKYELETDEETIKRLFNEIPDANKSYDMHIEIHNKCPKCGYEW